MHDPRYLCPKCDGVLTVLSPDIPRDKGHSTSWCRRCRKMRTVRLVDGSLVGESLKARQPPAPILEERIAA